MIRWKSHLNTVACAALIAGGFVVAGPVVVDGLSSANAAETQPGRHGRRAMERICGMDTDGDGTITRAEADAKRSAEFQKFDGDGDGSLSKAEFEAMWLERHRERINAAFSRLDGDDSAGVSDAEFAKPTDRFFRRADANKDDAVTGDEVREMREKVRERRRGGPNGERSGSGERERGKARAGWDCLEEGESEQ